MSKRLLKRKLLPLYILAPLIAFFSFTLFFSGKDARSFRSLSEKIFKEELSGNTLNLHYTLAHPENFGISHVPAVLPVYSAASGAESAQTLNHYLEKLADIDKKKLTESEQYTYTLLERYLTHVKNGERFSYYEEPLSPASGMQTELPILLAEYTFRTKQDVEDYLALLGQTDAYFSSLLTFEQEKKDAGLLQADTSLEKVRDQCYVILNKHELERGTHFLQTTFSERLQGLVDSELLTSEEAEKYRVQNDRLLTTVMQPAYEKLADGLFLLISDKNSTPKGLASLPGGRDYYAWLVQKNTGSALSVDSLKAVLYPRFDSLHRNMNALLLSRPDAAAVWLNFLSEDSFPLSSPEEILSDLQERMAADFPAFPQNSFGESALPKVTVKPVSPSLETYTAPAFYLTPPIDDLENNVIYINKKSTPAGLELYTTLAHEGYPGHLYQSVYSQLSLQKEKPPVRQLLWYGGYLEGWAVYTEFISYDYAAELASSQGKEDAAFAYTLQKHNRDLQLCLYALLDIAIHYDNASYEQIHKVLSAFGIGNADTTRRIYDYIAEEPANYLKYYVGYLEILNLKEAAKKQWGDAYSDLRFHTFYLNCGPSDFTTLSEALLKQLP